MLGDKYCLETQNSAPQTSPHIRDRRGHTGKRTFCEQVPHLVCRKEHTHECTPSDDAAPSAASDKRTKDLMRHTDLRYAGVSPRVLRTLLLLVG
ncbi:hypothetical protein TPADAL_0063a [Treponema pallidum subsp. pallidum DAL-1]|uniref:Uncharacterized protein n=2 Tax=Treponema pallidum TaxID=160 RepID=A0AAU8RM97_TREPL|nr:hypothetical protein TPESAMD_0063a [Treponema pallidum subsp. pertenue str. SamoaD]AEZ58247.1 hypothetical protein TPECDC2_0063a [Treponema pallidum subsp. pertenue str. CDC2]AEZ59315.1 hypothetical protein TPEGAU_0063a [Treponema pallidum subsp. pertenue str. Gauthier]AEZ60381.1 hypothetical protein TPADAL_0063a [Treponema pallidum subsp. pallidum DAL-1]AGK83703.1 hypothetical protein TPFB_0063a [Treponema pallidum str. Fribourg-Blanc]AJB40079.1 hypothetical protein TENDBA_0063a [Treponema